MRIVKKLGNLIDCGAKHGVTEEEQAEIRAIADNYKADGHDAPRSIIIAVERKIDEFQEHFDSAVKQIREQIGEGNERTETTAAGISREISDNTGGRSAADVAAEQPISISEIEKAGSTDSDDNAVPGSTDSSIGNGAGGQRPGAIRNLADVSSPAHVTGSARNFTITNELNFSGIGDKTKYRNNVAAIRTLKQIEAEARPATPEEQSILAKYIGWGGLSSAFDAKKADWAKEYSELKDILLTPEEYETAISSTRNAHYTAAEIVQGIWKAVQRLGFDRGSVLEPSMGTGNFFGLMPRELRRQAKLTGVEFDHITGGIAKLLYPQARVHAPLGFQDIPLAPGSIDLAIGNPPFGATSLFDPSSKELSKFKIHGYFFAKSVDALRPGGVLAMVVSKGFMDANDAIGQKQRQYVAEKTRLLGAIRLPDSAFKANAGTEVTTDIVFLQKLAPGEESNTSEWDSMATLKDKATGGDISVNKYFAEHPEMMLGEMMLGGKMYRAGSTTLSAREGDNLPELLNQAIENLPQGVFKSGKPTAELNQGSRDGLAKVKDVKVYGYFESDGKLYQRMPDINGEYQQVELLREGREAARINGMIELRDTVRRQLLLESSNKSSEEAIERNRELLNNQYDAFVKKNGHLNNDTNKRLFWDDSDSPLVRSLEKSFDKGLSKDLAKKQGKEERKPEAKKADIFTKRVLNPVTEVTEVTTAPDALAACMNERGRIDLEYMAKIYGKAPEKIIEELGSLVYEDPSEGWQTASQYLSGNVKAKLSEALLQAKIDPKYHRNVEALVEVQPPDVPAAEIYVAPHSFWIPEEVFHQFAKDILNGTMRGGYSRTTARWSVEFSGYDTTLNYQKYGTARMGAAEIMQNLMANRQIVVTDPHPTDRGVRVVNPTETAAAQGKADELIELFQDWIWKDQERRQNVVRMYNDRMNTTIDTHYDGSHLTLPGKSPLFVFRPHQLNVVFRAVQSGVVLLDHVVGSGKTAVKTAIAMEMRRLGLANKPMITVPNHLVEQWSKSFAKIYPNANILAATKKDFEKKNRRALFAKIATGDWDAVIVAHSSFKFIPVPREIELEILNEQKAEIIQALKEAKEDAGKRLSVKSLEAMKESVDNKLKALADVPKDDLIDFRETGVDALLVDEAHEFKNLFYTTQMQNVAGLGSPKGSGRAFDMFIKTQYLMRRNGGKGVIFATGTPVSNSLAEVFHMQRFLQYGELKARGLHNFDAWASAFGQATSDWEQDAGGRYKQKTRFRKLVNLPELKQLWGAVTDTVTNPDLIRDAEAQGERFPLPKVEGGKPKNVVVERSPQQAEYIGVPHEVKDSDGNVMVNKETGVPVMEYDEGTIVYRMENWLQEFKNGNTREMPLVITGDARKAGLDFRLIDENAPDFAGSKVNTAVNEIFSIHQENDYRKGTQLVFIDLSTPKSQKGKTMEKLAEAVPTYFIKDRGTIQHVNGKPITLSGMPDTEFFSFKKGKKVSIYERQSGVFIQEGVNVTEARQRAEDRIESIGPDSLTKRFRDLAIPSEQIDDYIARWEDEQNKKDDDGAEDEAETKETEISFDDILADSGKSSFSVYDDVKAKLIARGISEDQIAFIHDANTDAQKADLFAKVNAGIVRVLLGSTQKMGAGTNVQKKLVALHHLDCPWKPSDLMQREGRIIRQGNEFYDEDPDGFIVKIRRYATMQTYDSRMWEIIETKAKAIELFKTGGKDVREVEDVSSESANAAEIKASAAGNPLMLEDLQLKNDIKKYEAMEKSWKRARYDMEDAVQSVANKSTWPHKQLVKYIRAEADIQPKDPKKLGLKLGKKTYDVKEDFEPAEMFKVLGRAHVTSLRDLAPVEIGSYRGLTMYVQPGISTSSLVVSMRDSAGFDIGNTKYTEEDKFSVPGLISRLDNIVSGVQENISSLNEKITKLEAEAESAKEALKDKFRHADTLAVLKEKHKKVVAALRAGKKSIDEDAPAKSAEAVTSEDTINDGMVDAAVAPMSKEGRENVVTLDSLGLQQIYEKIANSKTVKDGMADLRTAGEHFYASGKKTWKEWFSAVKEFLGKSFGKFRAVMERTWSKLNGRIRDEYNRNITKFFSGEYKEMPHHFDVAEPSMKLKEAGINSTLNLKKSTIKRKMGEDSDHVYTEEVLLQLPNKANDPIFVFDHPNGNKDIVTDMIINNKPVLVGIESIKTGPSSEIASIRTIFGKRRSAILNWIDGGKEGNDGRKFWYDKNKAQKWLELSRTTEQSVYPDISGLSKNSIPFSNEAVNSSKSFLSFISDKLKDNRGLVGEDIDAPDESDFTPEEWKQMAETAGMSVKEIKQTLGYKVREPFTTSTKNAVTEEERADRGLDPVEQHMKYTDPVMYEEGMRLINSKEYDPRLQARELVKHPRSISAAEQMALLHDRVAIRNESNDVMEMLIKANEAGDTAKVLELRQRLALLEDAFNENDEAARKVGTEWSAAGRARQLLMAEDYSYIRNVSRIKAAGGKDLTPELKAKIEKLTQDLDAAVAKHIEYERKIAAMEAEKWTRRAVAEIVRPDRPTTRQSKPELSQKYKSVSDRLRRSLAGKLNFMFDPADAALLVEMAKIRIEQGMRKAEEISADIYDEMKSYGLKHFDAVSERDIRDAISGYGKSFKMNQEEIATEMREIKRQMRLLSSYEDAKSGEPPLRTGLQRDPVTDKVRELQKMVKQAMRESGIDSDSTKSAEELWKTALDSVKTRLKNQIFDLNKQIETGEKTPKKIGVVYDEEASALKAERDRLKAALVEIEGKPEMSAEQRVRVAVSAVEKSISEYERRISENDLNPKKPESKTPETPLLAALREKRDALKKVYKDMQDASKPEVSDEDRYLKLYKARQAKRLVELQTMLDTGNFDKKVRRSYRLDPEAQALAADVGRIKNLVDQEIRRAQLANRSKFEKTLDWGTKIRRAVILSGSGTLAKLTAAATVRSFVTNPAEEVVGEIVSMLPIISKISAQAPREGGGVSVRAEAAAFKQWFMKETWKDTWNVVRTGRSELENLYGKHKDMDFDYPPEWIEFFGRIHGALKNPAKRAEFSRALQKRSEWAIRNNMDLTDPTVMAAVTGGAYVDSLRTILMDDNAAVKMYKMMLNYMENQGDAGKLAAFALKMEMPIIKIPTNFAAEVGLHGYGFLYSAIKARETVKNRPEDMTLKDALYNHMPPDDADAVMRGIKKQIIGMILLAIGYSFFESIGGFHRRGEKRKPGELKAHEIKIKGHKIEKHLQHQAATEVVQAGATVARTMKEHHEATKKGRDADGRKVKDIYNGEGAPDAEEASLLAVLNGVLKNIPFIETPRQVVTSLESPKGTNKFLATQVESLVTPPDVRKIAKAQDTFGEVLIPRQTDSFKHVMMGSIPGQRKNVPIDDRRLSRMEPTDVARLMIEAPEDLKEQLRDKLRDHPGQRRKVNRAMNGMSP